MPSRRSSAAYRIAFAYSAVFATGVAALGIVIFWAMHVAFVSQLDATVSDEASTLLADYRNEGGGEFASAIAEREQARSPARLFYAVYSPDGRRIAGSFRAARPPLGLQNLPFEDAKEGPDTARGLAIDLSPDKRLVVAIDREWVEQTDATVITVFAVGFLGACIAGLLGALAFGRYLQGRLQAISTGAETIIAGDIRGRIPVSRRGDEFDELAGTLNRMLDRIERLIENLREVSSAIAHDLRTPLARVRHRLERSLSDSSSEQLPRQAVERAIDEVDELFSLFAAILRISEVEGGDTRRFFTRVDLSVLVTELAESYSPAVVDGGRVLLWSIDPDLVVEGDRELIAQAVSNLLENAQRHTPMDTTIRLSAAAANDRILITVADNGPGVPAADHALITDRFRRLDRSRNTPGHGLGLNLVKAIAELHCGTLEFADLGPGLAATLSIPAGIEPAV